MMKSGGVSPASCLCSARKAGALSGTSLEDLGFEVGSVTAWRSGGVAAARYARRDACSEDAADELVERKFIGMKTWWRTTSESSFAVTPPRDMAQSRGLRLIAGRPAVNNGKRPRPLRLEAQDTALSRRQHRFESGRGRQ